MTPKDRALELIHLYHYMWYETYSEKEKAKIMHSGVSYQHALQFAITTAEQLKNQCALFEKFDDAYFYSEVETEIHNIRTNWEGIVCTLNT